MKRFAIVAIVIGATLMSASAQLKISLTIRESGSTEAIGDASAYAGEFETINLDGQTLILDGTWQKFTFDMDADPVTGWIGDGAITADSGMIEHIRISNPHGILSPLEIYIDDLVDTVDNAFGIPTDYPIAGGWEAPYVVGDEVVFQEPTYSGSTGSYIAAGATAGVTDVEAHSGTQSYALNYSYSTDDPAAWLRLTTHNVVNNPFPTVRFDGNSVISFWMKGVPEPSTAVLLGAAALALIRRR